MPKLPPVTFADRLRALRKKAGLTIEAVAEKIGVSRSTVGYWEDGTEPGVSDIRSLARLFGCTADYLVCLTDAEQPFPPGHFLIDLAVYEARKERKKIDPKEKWRVVIPARYRVVSPREFALMDDSLPPNLR